ncbi:hypothetical protein HF086_009104 [Spodoptera exigua]|uniref:Uncharacterized protein n=1 Tax=Spodoptera exigua TaxID=7107 RepID=A0A922MNL4_SPOEX|nr:hypothetical protein HF086_009104 [Spodoptera exigua]
MNRDELLAKKRAAEKARRDKIKLNPEAHAQYKDKERQRYKKRKEDKKLREAKTKTLLQKKLAESTPPDLDFDDEAQPQNILPAQPSPSPFQQSSDDLQPENILPVQPSFNLAQSSNTPSSPAQFSLAASPSVVQNRVLTRRQLPNITQSSNSPSNPAQST